MLAIVGAARRRMPAEPATGAEPGRRWLLLDTVLRALESAGLSRATCANSALGLFVAAPLTADLAPAIANFLAGRGPCETLDAGGASALATIGRAAGALRLDECRLAIAIVTGGGELHVLVLEPAGPARARGALPRALLRAAGAGYRQGNGERSAVPDWDALHRLLAGEPIAASLRVEEAGGGGIAGRLEIEAIVPASSQHDPIVPIRAGGGPACCWIHGVSGDVGWVLPLARALGPGPAVLGIEAQGLDGRAPVLPTIEAMAEHYATSLAARRIDGPLWLGGYSGGGMLALETAQRLRQKGVPVGRLILLDANAPGNPALDRAHVEGFIFLLAGNWYGHLWGADRPLAQDALIGRDRRAQLEATLDHLYRHARPPLPRAALALRLEAMEAISETMRVAMQRYRPEPLPGPVETLFLRCARGLGDHGGRFRLAPTLIDGDYRTGWQALLERPLTTVELDCDHWQLVGPGWIDRAAAIIQRWSVEGG